MIFAGGQPIWQPSLKSKDWKAVSMADDTKTPEQTAAPEEPAPVTEEVQEAPEIDARDLEIVQLKEEAGAAEGPAAAHRRRHG